MVAGVFLHSSLPPMARPGLTGRELPILLRRGDHMSSTGTVLMPSSTEEAVAAVASDPEITVIGGGTLVVPQHNVGGRAVDRALWLGRAGLDEVRNEAGTITLGAAVSLAACGGLPAPLGPCAANVGDGEVQAQATIGGNISAPAPYGDLRGPLLALEATVRVGSPDGVEDVAASSLFAGGSGGRLVLEISFAVPAGGSFVALQRHHTQALTAMGISAVRTAGGEVRLAATGAAPQARRLAAAEAVLADGGSGADAGEAALADIDPYDDVLASAAYRRRVMPALVRRAVDELGG